MIDKIKQNKNTAFSTYISFFPAQQAALIKSLN